MIGLAFDRGDGRTGVRCGDQAPDGRRHARRGDRAAARVRKQDRAQGLDRQCHGGHARQAHRRRRGVRCGHHHAQDHRRSRAEGKDRRRQPHGSRQSRHRRGREGRCGAARHQDGRCLQAHAARRQIGGLHRSEVGRLQRHLFRRAARQARASATRCGRRPSSSRAAMWPSWSPAAKPSRRAPDQRDRAGEGRGAGGAAARRDPEHHGLHRRHQHGRKRARSRAGLDRSSRRTRRRCGPEDEGNGKADEQMPRTLPTLSPRRTPWVS